MPIKISIQKFKTLMSNKKLIKTITLVFVLIIMFVLIKTFYLHPQKKAIPPRPVETAIASQKDVPIYLESFGTMVAPQDVTVKSQVTGEIQKIHFVDGQEIAKGDLLITIDPSQYKAELDKAEAALAQDAVNLKLAKDTLERNSQLVKSNLISKQDFEKYQTDVSSAEAKVRLDTANVDVAKITLGYCSICSPISGIMGKRQVDAGNIVIANSGPTLVTIKAIDTLYVDFTIPEKDLSMVRKAMAEGSLKVEISVEGDDNGPYSGDVIFIDNTVDNTTGTVALRGLVDNKTRVLWAGQFVQIKLILGIKIAAVLVPYEAVQLGRKGNYIFAVTADNTADLRQVTPGNRQGNYIVVKEGVIAGEKIVTSGQMGLSQGVTVMDVSAFKAEENKTANKK